MKSLRLLFLTALALFASVTMAWAAGEEFTNPKIGKNRLDYCFSWQEGCGQKAADAFCVSKDYKKASDFTIAQGIGANTPTRTIGDNSVCDSAGCDGFMSITCEKAPLVFFKLPIYSEPEVDGTRVDWCFGWSKQCGKPAADAFCKLQGHKKATEFEKAVGVGPTRVLSTGQLCDDPTCDGFKVVTCGD
jgi:hypothetical protein